MAALFSGLKRVANTNNNSGWKRRVSSVLSLQYSSWAPQDDDNEDFAHALHMVQSHDPAGNMLPGRLLSTTMQRQTYFAVRSFWVETGLRFGTTARVEPHSSPAQHLDWWQKGIDRIFESSNGESSTEPKKNDDGMWMTHPTLRLLHSLIWNPPGDSTTTTTTTPKLSKQHFDNVLSGRRQELDVVQYPTLESLVDQAALSCSSLFKIVLESGPHREVPPSAVLAAHEMGICHGLTNALRLSIPLVSTTGRLILPQDLCHKHGVKSPRYLLSALGMGDEDCKRGLQQVVRDVSDEARLHLEKARSLRSQILQEEDGSASSAMSVLLPGLASESFLDRLAAKEHDLTDRNLRHVGFVERSLCGLRILVAHLRNTF